MGLYEYMLLSETEQWYNLWNRGTFLKHHTPRISNTLYALYNFFVEIELDPVADKIKSKVEFKTGASLERYSGSIVYILIIRTEYIKN